MGDGDIPSSPRCTTGICDAYTFAEDKTPETHACDNCGTALQPTNDIGCDNESHVVESIAIDNCPTIATGTPNTVDTYGYSTGSTAADPEVSSPQNRISGSLQMRSSDSDTETNTSEDSDTGNSPRGTPTMETTPDSGRFSQAPPAPSFMSPSFLRRQKKLVVHTSPERTFQSESESLSAPSPEESTPLLSSAPFQNKAPGSSSSSVASTLSPGPGPNPLSSEYSQWSSPFSSSRERIGQHVFRPYNEKLYEAQQPPKSQRKVTMICGLTWAVAHGVGACICIVQTVSMMAVIWAIAHRYILFLLCMSYGCIALICNFAIFSLATTSTGPYKLPPFKPHALPFEFVPPPCSLLVFAFMLYIFEVAVSTFWMAVVKTILVFTTTEPNGDRCDDWLSFFALCVISLIVNGVAVCVQAIKIFFILGTCDTVRERNECQQLCAAHRSEKSCWNILKYILDGVVALLFITGLIFVIVPLSLVMSDYNYCDPSSELCYSGCNPYDPSMCMLPFPSTFYLKSDNTTPTGWRVNISSHASVRDRWGTHVGNTDQLNELDGFSVSAPILCYFEEVSLDGVIGLSNLSTYTSPYAKTVVINTATNELIPHWVELDAMDNDTPLLLIQPAQVLNHATRYVVGIRWLLNNNGGYILRTPYFDSLLQEQTGDDWDYLSKNVWPYLQDKGWLLDDVLLMWDFITVSEDYSLGRVKLMLQEANSHWAGSLSYSFDEIKTHECTPDVKGVAKSLWGHFNGPKFVSLKRGGLLLSRPGAKQVLIDTETLRVNFLIEIPCSVWLNPKPSFILQFGHSFFEDRSEIQADWMRDFSYNNSCITFAVDWYGISRLDTLVLSDILLRNLLNFVSIPECTMQSFINAHLMLKLMTLQLVNDPEMQASGISLIDSTRYGFYGLSEGSIVGGGYLGMSDMLNKAVMGVGGTPFSVILPRNFAFHYINMMLRITVYTQREIRLLLSLYQALWDPADFSGWVESLNRDRKPILIQSAIDDLVVSNYATHILARSLQNTTLIAPEARPVWPLESRVPPEPQNSTTTSWMVEWMFDSVEPLPDTSNPPPRSSPNPHPCPCRLENGQDQAWEFLSNGTITQYCQGVCLSPLCKV
ncbi:ATP-dependent DNA helicase RecG [Pelomyxa schiedti]|nr:ATP-dependent DNA helicase RecG [Pelomyxa schiedti]